MRIFRFVIAIVMSAVSIWAVGRGLREGNLQQLQAPPVETAVATVENPVFPVEPEPPVPMPVPDGVDLAAPHLLSIVISPAEVDTTASTQTLTVTVRISDNLSGLKGAVVHFVPALGSTQFLDFELDASVLVSGNELNGVYQAAAILPQHAANGRWYLAGVDVVDNANNRCGEFGLGSTPVGIYPTACAIAGEAIYFINGEDSGPSVIVQPDPVQPEPMDPTQPLPPDNGGAADSTPWANEMFMPVLGD